MNKRLYHRISGQYESYGVETRSQLNGATSPMSYNGKNFADDSSLPSSSTPFQSQLKRSHSFRSIRRKFKDLFHPMQPSTSTTSRTFSKNNLSDPKHFMDKTRSNPIVPSAPSIDSVYGTDTGTESPESSPLNGLDAKRSYRAKKRATLPGLFNHGNTCYANAILQCLANTDWLAEYFVSERFRNDLKPHSSKSQQLGTQVSLRVVKIWRSELWISGPINLATVSSPKIDVGVNVQSRNIVAIYGTGSVSF